LCHDQGGDSVKAMRSIVLPLLLIAGTSLPCVAQQPGAVPSMLGLVSISADLNGDGVKDRAVLLYDRESDGVDLAIYSSADGKQGEQPTAYVASLGWTGDSAGTTPEMTVDRTGALIVVFHNDASGQYRWRQQYTIAFHVGVFVVAKYSYTTRDTVTPGQGANCDVDFLSGQATRDGKPVKVPAPPTPLSAWSENNIPAVCSFP
jgi:hypothetical protein